MVVRQNKILTENTCFFFHSLLSEKKSNKNTLFSIIGNKSKQSDRVLYEAFCWIQHEEPTFLYEWRKLTGQGLFSENVEIRGECEDFLCKKLKGSSGARYVLKKIINSSRQVQKVKPNTLTARNGSGVYDCLSNLSPKLSTDKNNGFDRPGAVAA